METAVVQQFLDFFQDFINLCNSQNWPSDNTTEDEIKNAFLTAQHIEKCLDRLQKNNIIDEFLTAINDSDVNASFIKSSFADPPKYVLKKIINSATKITMMDVGVRIFLGLYSEQKLEDCLTDFMVEAASNQTLLKNLSELPKHKVLKLKSCLFISELQSNDSSDGIIVEMMKNCDQGTVDLVILSSVNKDVKFSVSVTKINAALVNVMSSKSHVYQNFWKCLFTVEDECLTDMCIEHNNLLKLVSKALIDCGKLLRQHMSAELFYINLTYTELVIAMQKLCKSVILRQEIFSLISESDSDVSFWENMLS